MIVKSATAVGVFSVIVGFSTAAYADEAPQRLGEIARSTGDVRRSDVGDIDAGVASGEPVFRGTKFRTGRDGNVEIKLTNGSVMRIRPDSSLQLSPTKRRRRRRNSVVLFFGRLWSGISSAVGGDDNYTVNTPTAVAGVRGTEFETAVGLDGSVRVRVDEGYVAVNDGEASRDVKRGQRVDSDVGGLERTKRAKKNANWNKWSATREQRVKRQGRDVMQSMKSRIEARQAQIEQLRKQREELAAEIKRWERDMRLGDPSAVEKIRELNQQIADLDDTIADLADGARSQFGYVDRLAELAADPRFGMIGAADIEREAETLLKLKKQFDAFEKEGRDTSIRGMDQMIEDFRGGKRDTLREEPGSVKDLFGD